MSAPRRAAAPAAPDYGRGYLRVPLAVWLAVFCRAPLTRRQLQLVAVVIRESWGWQRGRGEPYLWTRPLAAARFAEATGLSTDRISRDLRELVDRGVLRESGRCYQFVPDPDVWLARPEAPPIKRRRTAGPAVPAADPALLPGGTYIANIEERNDADNLRADRFIRLVLGMVGPLPPGLWADLRRWVRRVGVAAAWERLEPGLRRGPATGRALLVAALAEERARGREGPGEPSAPA